jgi:hypothetical protein
LLDYFPGSTLGERAILLRDQPRRNVLTVGSRMQRQLSPAAGIPGHDPLAATGPRRAKLGSSLGTAIVPQPRCEPINAGLIRTQRPI